MFEVVWVKVLINWIVVTVYAGLGMALYPVFSSVDIMMVVFVVVE